MIVFIGFHLLHLTLQLLVLFNPLPNTFICLSYSISELLLGCLKSPLMLGLKQVMIFGVLLREALSQPLHDQLRLS